MTRRFHNASLLHHMMTSALRMAVVKRWVMISVVRPSASSRKALQPLRFGPRIRKSLERLLRVSTVFEKAIDLFEGDAAAVRFTISDLILV